MFTQNNVRKMATAIGTFLGEACNARDELDLARHAVKELFEEFDEESIRINVLTNSGCPVCTEGTVPDRLNTGLCSFHWLEKFAREANA